MRLIDADALLNLPFEKMIHTDYGDTCVPIEEIEMAPTIDPFERIGAICNENCGYKSQGDCENCDYKKFTETFVDGVVEVMNKNGITSLEQLNKMLKGGAE